ncbi:nickel pincer cofactor biosynthesis protein LarB [Paenibacillus tyrfis]|uniref:nickel pincer cofactor biosynthesis protein LarB n=1 Tax=Paenibacillus tyrfis TaxID=1501230 RepID=UPI00209E8820|nr:nickel pincer cofactor biosynthesis protein LarB [Paenibacillus tyrfis]MCP1307381.1 nickel pincer cofactor biosynthesis protein LarB [Paenibacillus tyrfis]
MMNIDNILKLVQSGDLDIAEAKRLLEEGLSGEQTAPGRRQETAVQAGRTPEQPAIDKNVKDAGENSTVETPMRRKASFLSLSEDAVDDSLGYAQLDLSRPARTGFPEVIYGESKSAEQIAAIFERLAAHTDRVLATRVDADKAAYVAERIPGVKHHPEARALTWLRSGEAVTDGGSYIAVVCAGTSDVPVAEEAAVTAECLGSRVERVYDVGVAGIHRLFRRLPVIRGASAVVVVAGMEGALASVLGGLVAVPVIAVPTSVGYGASFQGVAALLSMLNACAPGISVVNIDNGFGAGYNAALIHQNGTKRDEN